MIEGLSHGNATLDVVRPLGIQNSRLFGSALLAFSIRFENSRRDILMNTVGRIPQMQRVLSAMISGTLVDPFSAIELAEKRFEAG